MAKPGLTVHVVRGLQGTVDLLLQHAVTSLSPFAPHDSSSYALKFAITAVAGVAIAAALGGALVLSQRKKKRRPLTSKQWHAAFDDVSGRLVNPHKILQKVRFGGINPSIRAQVWPFILGFYALDSTHEEREAEKHCKRLLYTHLKMQCKTLRDSIAESTEASSEILSSSTEGQRSASSTSNGIPPGDTSAEESTQGDSEEEGSVLDKETMEATARESFPPSGIRDEKDTRKDSKEKLPQQESVLAADDLENTELKRDCLKASEDFINWQRIIRVDAVRMNAEWVPYSPTQANVTGEQAFELARSVDLRDDEHLEPCRQHHAARLVSILEAYALHDPETGYCQGMSDLLSPFVALLDEDYEAFWCFVQFMGIARYNFRTDEVGIRRQLNKISSIFKEGDPQLYSHFESVNAENCFFVYRMVVVLLRRELSFEQTISLWEVIWAENTAIQTTIGQQKMKKGCPIEDLILFVIVAAVRQRRKVIIEKCKEMDELLKECNSMAGHLDVWRLLHDARELAYAVSGRIPDKDS